MEAINLLIYPFTACVLLLLIHTYFGIHILERGIIFVDLSLAQFIGLGIAFSFLTGHEETGRYIFATAFAIIGASILSLSKKLSKFINIEAFIGILYIFSLSVSLLILDLTPHGLEEFKNILNGNILWLTSMDVFNTFILYAVIGLLHIVFRKKFYALTFEGYNSVFWEFIFFLSFSFVLVKSVQTAGILQVFSFLIIPALIGRLFTKKIHYILLLGWLIGLLSSFMSIIVSYKLDLPTAPLIVAFLSITFFLLLIIKIIKNQYFKSIPD